MKEGKTIKKTISLALVLAMLLSLCACGKSEAVSNVEALIEAIGEVSADSENAVIAAEEAYNALTDKEKEKVENYAALTDARVALNETLEVEQFRQSFIGEWVGVEDGGTISFDETGNATLDGVSFSYEIDGDRIHASILGVNVEFTISEDSDGILHLKSDAFELDCVREEYFDYFQPEAVEITAENWSEYFEIRECTEIYQNAFGEYTDVATGFGIFLKEEYLEKLSKNTILYPSEVYFEVQYNRLNKISSINKETGEYSFSEKNYFPEFSGLETAIMNASDFRLREADVDSSSGEAVPTPTEAAQSDGSRGKYVEDYMYNNFGAYMISGEEATSGSIYAKACYENPEVLRAIGTIYLNK